MASIPLEQYLKNLKQLKAQVAQKQFEAIIVPAANELLATIKNRIQVEGKNSSGRNIGSYSQTPGYYGKDAFVKKGAFKPVGKNGPPARVKGVKVVRPKTMYLQGGYKELRAIQGRPVDKVNLTYTGDLMLSYQLQAKAGAVLLGIVDERHALIRHGLEDGRRRKLGYGPVFSGTFTELDTYKRNVAKAATQIILKTLKQ